MASKPWYLSLWLREAIICMLAIGHAFGDATNSNFLNEPQDVVVKKGQPLTLSCNTPSDFLPSNITWRRDGEILTYTPRVHTLITNGSLRFRRVIQRKKVGLTDEGVYECLARNAKGVIVARKVNLKIAYIAKSFTEEPRSVRSSRNGLAHFHCEIQGVPNVQYSWEVNGSPLSLSDSRFTVFSSGTLEINYVTASDDGSYRCTASNTAGQKISQGANLTVIDQNILPQKLFSGPINHSVVVGERVTLECHVEGHPKPQIAWNRQDGKPISPSRSRTVGVSSLQLLNAQVNDSGVYVCQATSEQLSQPIQASATVTVMVPPRINSDPVELDKLLSVTVRLSCTSEGISTPNTRWLHNGNPVPITGGTALFKVNELVISNGMASDSGFYQCIVENEVGCSSIYSHVVFKQAENAPLPPDGLVARTMSSTEILLSWNHSVSRDGKPILAYSVHYVPTADGQEELQQVTSDTSNKVEQLLPYTNYTFYVVAYSSDGASVLSERVIKRTDGSIPIAAPEFELMDHTSESVKVTWLPLPQEKARGQVIYYKIYYRYYDGTSFTSWQSIEVSGDLTEYVLTGLQPNTKYDVRVLAGTNKGEPAYLPDEKWPWQSVTTRPVSGSGAPMTPVVQVNAINSTAVMVNWQSPDPNIITGYKIFISRPNEARGNPRIVPARMTSFTFNKLVPSTWYEIRVLAFNEIEGEAALKSVQTTGNSTGPPPLPPPYDVLATPLSNTSIKVTWRPPLFDTIRHISGYTIRFKQVSSMVHESYGYRRTDSDEHELIIIGLKPYTKYDLSVCTHSGNNNGIYGDSVQVETLEGLSPPPLEIECQLNRDNNVLLVNWKPPLESNGVVRSFIIMYTSREDDTGELWKRQNESADATQSVITDLQSDTMYYVKISAKTGAGDGVPSKICKRKTYNIQQVISTDATTVTTTTETQLPDQAKGIIIGIAIGLTCIILCIVIVICRRRLTLCFPAMRASETPVHYHGNGHVPRDNGRLADIGNRLSHSGSVELDSFMPMLTNLKENGHVNAKGTNGKVNGKNGFSHPHRNGVSNGRVPNGHHVLVNESTVPQINVQAESTLDDSSLRQDMTLETSLDDIDRSYESGEEEEESLSAHDELLPSSHAPQALLSARHTGTSNNTADDKAIMNSPQSSMGNESSYQPTLVTFKPHSGGTSTSGVNQSVTVDDTTDVAISPNKSRFRSGGVCNA